ncbi:MAG TPA: amidohydrolase family protein [Gemmatimonadaceae bacterium]|nr:amidohydrolase family protein [Gemmatimonadaceae bacterium]
MLILATALLLQGPQQSYVVASDSVVALTNARVIDGTGAPPRTRQTLIIRGGRIAAYGASATTSVPAGAAVRDLTGKTVIPGLVMLHEHLFYVAGGGAYPTHAESFPRLYLAGGVTTMRTAGNMGGYTDFNAARLVATGRIPGPDIFVTAPYFNGPGLPIPGVKGLRDSLDAHRMATYWADEGATSFKAYMQITRAELAAIIAVAHARGIKVTGHLCSVTYREAADLGIDNLEHGFFASTDFAPGKVGDQCPSGSAGKQALAARDVKDPAVQQLLQHLVAKGVTLTSTPTVFEISVPGQPKAPQGALDAMLPQVRTQYETAWERIARDTTGRARREYVRLLELEREFVRLGGRLVLGTDPTGYGGVVPGYANQRAIQLLVDAGFSMVEAIRIATLNGAALLGIDTRTGSIAVAKDADLVVIDGDPVSDATAITRMQFVFKRGVGYDSARLFASVKGVVGWR